LFECVNKKPIRSIGFYYTILSPVFVIHLGMSKQIIYLINSSWTWIGKSYDGWEPWYSFRFHSLLLLWTPATGVPLYRRTVDRWRSRAQSFADVVYVVTGRVRRTANKAVRARPSRRRLKLAPVCYGLAAAQPICVYTGENGVMRIPETAQRCCRASCI